jgi:predicted nucleic acid-binding protein
VARYVITPDVALHLAERGAEVGDGHRLLAPTLFRSQVLSRLYRSVREGRLTREEAVRRLEYVRGTRIRLLGDRVLQNLAWRIAERLGWDDTLDAEYVALTRLQADALVTLDPDLARAARDEVTVVSVEALS